MACFISASRRYCASTRKIPEDETLEALALDPDLKAYPILRNLDISHNEAITCLDLTGQGLQVYCKLRKILNFPHEAALRVVDSATEVWLALYHEMSLQEISSHEETVDFVNAFIKYRLRGNHRFTLAPVFEASPLMRKYRILITRGKSHQEALQYLFLNSKF